MDRPPFMRDDLLAIAKSAYDNEEISAQLIRYMEWEAKKREEYRLSDTNIEFFDFCDMSEAPRPNIFEISRELASGLSAISRVLLDSTLRYFYYNFVKPRNFQS